MAVRADAQIDFDEFEKHRRELTAYCYRMLGSSFEAEDAVQETLVRAWKAADRFEGRSSVRSWLYRIATNVCLDMLRSSQRRARPMDVGPASTTDAFDGAQRAECTWIEPIPDGRVMPTDADPAEIAAERETIKLAFVTALQHLPARQRAVLILREVLHWHADEVAELLDSSVASVNSALQRARASMADVPAAQKATVDADQAELLKRYVDAFERYDVAALVELLHDDVVQSMPPYEMWLVGPEEISKWFLGPGIECKGSRLLPTSANGCPAFGQYRVDPAGGWSPWSLQVLEITDGRITGMNFFLDTKLFEEFGLPPHLDN